MNVVILTPDRVGSTLLQRLITVYMLGHEYDKPVINLHELTNGLELYYNNTFNRVVVGKPKGTDWGYHQTLKQITVILEKADNYKTSRLAHYHIVNRKDSIEEQIPFYEYLNNNFFIISARRNNLLEHTLSWGIRSFSKKLNVYSHEEKVNVFYNIYKDGIIIPPEQLKINLEKYKNYIEWCNNYFQVNSYFDYEKDINRIEQYILDLPIFNGQQKRTWKDIFNIEWKDWNQCHKLISDLGSVQPRLLNYDNSQGATSLQVVQNNLSVIDQQFIISNSENYKKAYDGINELVANGTLVTNIPIKLQTLSEKKKVIKNFAECVDTYNEWVEKNGIGKQYTDEEIIKLANTELLNWYKEIPTNLLLT